MEITSINNKLVMYANSLKEKKYRDNENKYLIEGEHLISMCCKDDIECIFTTKDNYNLENVKVYNVNENVLKKLSFVQANQGIVAIVKKKNYQIDYHKNRYLICDGVSDPGNLGTIIRSSLAFNVDFIILSKGSVDIYNDKVIRGSQGAILKIPIIYADIKETILNLKENGIKVLASTLASDSINLKNVNPSKRFALIVGNEGQGISKDSFSLSDERIKIKHSQNIDSLNVGVATSIMLYYLDFKCGD